MTARALATALRACGHDIGLYIANLPLDLRRCIPEARYCMANYVSTTSGSITIVSQQQEDPVPTSPQALTNHDWTTAQGLTDNLSQISSTLVDQPVALLKYFSNFRNWTLKQASKPADSSFEVSNVGVFDSSPSLFSQYRSATQSQWPVHDMVLSQWANALGTPLNVNVASTMDGPLAIVMTWWPGMLGMEDEERFVNEVCEGIAVQMAEI